MQFQYRRILEQLAKYDVEFMVIGGVCAVAHGAPITTFDLDVLHRQTDENIDRILACLDSIHAYHREPGPRRLPPQRAALEASGPSLFSTDYGSVDFLGEISNKSFDEIMPDSILLDLCDGLKIRILKLEALIQAKRDAGRAKDLAVLPVLMETLNQRSKQ